MQQIHTAAEVSTPERPLEIGDYKSKAKHCQHAGIFSPGMLTCLSAFGKQNEVLNQGWHVANQVFKALEKGKGVEAFYVGVVKVINHRG